MAREIITLESTAGTGTRYSTMKNKKTTTERIQLRKFDWVTRKHEIFKEKK